MKEDFIEEITFDLFVVELAIADVAILSIIQDKLMPEAPEDGKTYGRNNAEWVEVTEGVTSHPYLNDKNAEANFQHVTQSEKEKLTNLPDNIMALIYAGL